MLRSVSEWHGCTLHATDGDIGHVADFLFDDAKWTIRYLVVDTGRWLPGRRVLISPIALGETDWAERRLRVKLTRQQVEDSPDIDTDKPVSRQHETSYFQYYGWPYYWGGPFLWGPAIYPGALITQPTSVPGIEPAGTAAEPEGDPHLRSTGVVAGYRIQARGGEIGHVGDFIVDEESWAIRYIVVETGSWWPGKRVLLPPQWIDQVSWAEATVEVNLDRDTIKNGPEWDPHSRITREDEARLYGYYRRPGYWLS